MNNFHLFSQKPQQIEHIDIIRKNVNIIKTQSTHRGYK